MQVERTTSVVSGERVSNALVTCPGVWDNRPKGLLIPHDVVEFRSPRRNGEIRLWEGPATHQLVGKVTAYQGDDG
jgi:hypothetical protein